MLGSNGDTITVGYPSESSMLAKLATNTKVDDKLPTDAVYTFDAIPATTKKRRQRSLPRILGSAASRSNWKTELWAVHSL